MLNAMGPTPTPQGPAPMGGWGKDLLPFPENQTEFEF